MSTPVSNPSSPSNQYVFMGQNIASSPEVVEAGVVARETVQEIRQEVSGGEWDWSLRVLTLIGGCTMMLASLNGFLGKFVNNRWNSLLIDIIVFCIGIGVVLVESGVLHRVDSCSPVDQMINSHAPFLKNYQGRGAVFIVTGLLELWMRGFLDKIAGFFAIYVGFLYLWSGKQAKEKMEEALSMAQASGNISLEAIQEMFANADVDGKGGLSLSQWRLFTESLGMQLSKKESEAAFMLMDKNHDGRLSYDEVHLWWANGQK